MKEWSREATIIAKEGLAKGGIQAKILEFPLNLGGITIQIIDDTKFYSIAVNFGLFLIQFQLAVKA